MINWKVRVKNKMFWVTLIPLILVLIGQIAMLFGITIEISDISNQLVGIVETIFLILALVGVVNDPTTDGIKDSAQAMTYNFPKKE